MYREGVVSSFSFRRRLSSALGVLRLPNVFLARGVLGERWVRARRPPAMLNEKGCATVGVAVERCGARGVARGIPLLALDERRRGVNSLNGSMTGAVGALANRLANGVANRADVDCDIDRLLSREWVELVDPAEAAEALDVVLDIAAPPTKDDDLGSLGIWLELVDLLRLGKWVTLPDRLKPKLARLADDCDPLSLGRGRRPSPDTLELFDRTDPAID